MRFVPINKKGCREGHPVGFNLVSTTSRPDRVVPTDRCVKSLLTGEWHHIDATSLAVEHHCAVDQRKERIIFPLANTFPRVKLISKLAHDNVARDDFLTTETFYTAPLSIRIATVATRTLSFFMCHGISSELEVATEIKRERRPA